MVKNDQIKLDYSNVILDEAQDSNPITQQLVFLIRGKKVTVGDKYQAIYDWRGASNAMNAISYSHKAELTKSFRFGDSLADLANACLRKYAKAATNFVGNEKINTIISSEPITHDKTTILCRTNASMISEMMKSIATGRKPCLMKGTKQY
ncbi:UvrD-helicase domain-containing protein [Psychromonas aquimarina]|uniref:UvrD-helicase domain-containing protein n=1 Tax=Psychromonas aquimarina TaxID=444919 RepID=UPI00048F3FC4|nr:UvrD-helicase domain-containing protein [Psychromonas aquimarina]